MSIVHAICVLELATVAEQVVLLTTISEGIIISIFPLFDTFQNALMGVKVILRGQVAKILVHPFEVTEAFFNGAGRTVIGLAKFEAPTSRAPSLTETMKSPVGYLLFSLTKTVAAT